MIDSADPNNSTMLARDVVGGVAIELSRLPGGDILLDVSYLDEVIRVGRYPNITDFQAGRIFEYELAAYRGIVK